MVFQPDITMKLSLKRKMSLRVIRNHEEDQAQLLPTAKARELQRIFQFRNVKGLSHRIYYSLMQVIFAGSLWKAVTRSLIPVLKTLLVSR